MSSLQLNDVYIDVPYITEGLDENNLSKVESSAIGQWCGVESRNNSDSPSPSSSFRDDGILLSRKQTVPFVFVSVQPYRTSSLDDVRSQGECGCRSISRHSYGRRSQYSEYTGSSRTGSSRRKGSTTSEGRRSSVRSSIRSNKSRRSSNGLERNRSIRSTYSRRPSNNIIPTPPVIIKTEEDLKREKRHRIAVWLVLGSFIFIAISSILVVIITLTHQSEHIYDVNKTLPYYTFSRPSTLP